MNYKLKIVEAVVIDGKVKAPGAVVEVDRAVAIDLLRRGRAVNAEPGNDPRGGAQVMGTAQLAESETVNLASMTKAQLLEYATDNELDVPTSGTKAEIVAAIVAATE